MTDELLAYQLQGSVPLAEVPDPGRSRRQGIWTGLADVIVADYKSGKVTVVVVKNDDALKRLKNGVRVPLRDREPLTKLVTSTSTEEGGIRVYLRLVEEHYGNGTA